MRHLKDGHTLAIDTGLVLAHVIAMTISLAKDVLRSTCDPQPGPLAVTPELETWLLEAADNRSTPLTAGDFDGIRERVHNRIPTRNRQRPTDRRS
jgi:hypothetical protein